MIQRLHHGLISVVEWAGFLRRNRLVSGERLQNASRERSVKLFDQLQEEHAYLVAVGQQLIAAGMRDLLDQSLGPQLPQVITQGAECIVGPLILVTPRTVNGVPRETNGNRHTVAAGWERSPD